MNRTKSKPIGIIIVLLFILNSCSDSGEETDLCLNGPKAEVDDIKVSIEGKDNGEIMVSATEGKSPYQFSIDGTNFQDNGTFTDLAADDYTVIVKDANECINTIMATVEEVPEVFYGNQIRPIIDANCQISNCHGSNANIPTWATYNDVKAKATTIKFRTGNGSMPPNGSLSDSDIQLIADWVDQGAPEN